MNSEGNSKDTRQPSLDGDLRRDGNSRPAKRAAATAAEEKMRDFEKKEKQFWIEQQQKKRKGKNTAKNRPKSIKKTSQKAFGRGQKLKTGEFVGDIAIAAKTTGISKAPVELLTKYNSLTTTNAADVPTLEELLMKLTRKDIESVMVTKREGETIRDLQNSRDNIQKDVKMVNQGQSRLAAIEKHKTDKAGTPKYSIKKVGGGTILPDGGHVLGEKDDYEQRSGDEQPNEVQTCLRDFEMTGLDITPRVLMDVIVKYDDDIGVARGLVDETSILDLKTIKFIVELNHTISTEESNPIDIAQVPYLVWSIVWHCEQDGHVGPLASLLKHLLPELNWDFLGPTHVKVKHRQRKKSKQCIENERQVAEMSKGDAVISQERIVVVEALLSKNLGRTTETVHDEPQNKRSLEEAKKQNEEESKKQSKKMMLSSRLARFA